MNVSRNRVSRWTPAIFAVALGNLGLGLLFAISGFAWPAAAARAPVTLAMVHLFTIGWITLLMFGALFQFVPVITGRNLPGPKLPLVTLIGVEAGLLLMLAGFFSIGRSRTAGLLLPAGGVLVILAVIAGGVTLLAPLMRKRPRPLSADFIMAGLGFLVVTAVLGLCFACGLTIPAAARRVGPLLVHGLPYHVLSGLGGWFTLTAIGVSYELLPMFMLAPHERGVLGRLVFGLGAGGFAILFVAGIVLAFQPGAWWGFAEQAGRAIAILGVVLYLADVGRLYRDRRRKDIELHNRAAAGAFLSLAGAVVIALVAVATGRLPEAVPLLVVVVLLGWLSGLGLTQLYKIVPFLSWLHHFGSHLGRGPVPRVQDLVNEPVAVRYFALYFAAVWLLAVAGAFALPELFRAFAGVAFVAVLLLAREYRRAWSGFYTDRQGGGNSLPNPALSRIKGVNP